MSCRIMPTFSYEDFHAIDYKGVSAKLRPGDYNSLDVLGGPILSALDYFSYHDDDMSKTMSLYVNVLLRRLNKYLIK